MKPNNNGISLQQGSSLIEVMVAIFILGAGLLGLGGLQARSVLMNQSAYYRGISADLASDLADRIRANRSPFWSNKITSVDGVAGDPTIPSDLPLPPDFGKCKGVGDAATCAQVTARQSYRVLEDWKEWSGKVADQLPGGKPELTTDAATCKDTPTKTDEVFCRYTLKLTWKDDRSVKGGADLSYNTVIE